MIKETTKAWHKKQTRRVTGKPSKEHLAIFLAACEGKQIQARQKNSGRNADWKDVQQPAFVDTMEYRVKPPRMIPKYIQMYGYQNIHTKIYFSSCTQNSSQYPLKFKRIPELDYLATLYVPES